MYILDGGIPDAAAIHAARKRREAMRSKGGKDDFVPLKSTKKKVQLIDIETYLQA